MRLYVANTTAQNHEFLYRVLEVPNLRRMPIPAGSQSQVPGDFNLEEIEFIVQQHTPYGLVAADKVQQLRTYIGLCFSIDKPVQLGSLRYVFQQNQDVLIARGKEIQAAAAVAVSQQLNQAAAGLATVRDISVQLEEHKTDGSVRDVNTVYKVVNPGDLEPPTAPPGAVKTVSPRRRKAG